MRRRLVFFLIVGLLFLNTRSEDNHELIVETYVGESMSVFSGEPFTDEAEIARFLELIETSALSEAEVMGIPDYVITVNNLSESTMEAMVNVWVGEDDEILFTRGMEGTDVFEVDSMYTYDVNEILNLNNL
ncbi:hypothetical protein A6395_10485 [Exiguobacterium sp. SH31]|uniref:hypothetical protein n=1 Tax=unclassified Exiguobacterium TaxID=2644629 RepID=UPI0008AC7C4C|nr:MULTISPECIES: hypothetical protein [unclassified Exiguobacterium]OGX78759.1 hypothetical protein A6395_10485 [Exiguobacterium sp. SH31]TCI51915.1 hypothetical protein EVJ24_12345 [Exiguobacterium sp. SH1S21]TCI69049.1 hypothetical protein EVJ22_11295 [Exiguobacterium sp. SH0S7]